MSSESPPAGPSSLAAWTGTTVGAGGQSWPMQVLPDAGRPDLLYALPDAPRIACDRQGQPVFTLSLVLRERPGPAEDNVFELIQSGALACDVTLELPDVQSETLTPLYARQAEFQLRSRALPQAAPLAEAAGNGIGVRAGLAAPLDRTAAQAVLAALQRRASGLELRCCVTYRAAALRADLYLHAPWAAIHDYLTMHGDESGQFTREDLQRLLLGMVRERTLRAEQIKPGGDRRELTDGDGPMLLAAFLKISQIILQPVGAEPGQDATNPSFQLRARPHDSAMLDLRLTVTDTPEPCKELNAPLETVIGGLLEGLDSERFIHLLYVDPAGGGTRAVPVRTFTGPTATREGPVGDPATPTGLAAMGDQLTTMSRALLPNTAARPSAKAMAKSGIVQPHAKLVHAFAVNNQVLEHISAGAAHAGAQLPSLPVVEDPGAALWVDQANKSKYWYPPEFTLVPPDPAARPEDSPFLFTFRETGHDQAGRPVLEGEVLFVLRRGISQATRDALRTKNNPPAQAVPMNGLSIVLSLPMLGEGNRLRRAELAAVLTEQGDTITARVPLLNDFVRVAYGDLAIAGFQTEPAQVRVAYTYEAMTPAQLSNVAVHIGAKVVKTPVAFTNLAATKLARRDYFDATRLAYRSTDADVNFRREAPGSAGDANAGGEPSDAEPPEVSSGFSGGVGAEVGATLERSMTVARRAAKPLAAPRPAPVRPVIRPKLTPAVVPHELLKQRRFARQTLGCTTALDAFYPCNTLGNFYRHDRGDQLVAMGCQSSLALGQAPPRLYELINDSMLTSPYCRVYRSLSQPGRFLIVPAAYRITRYAPEEGERAYRPTVYLYTTLDAENATNNRCALMASLQADMPPWVRRDLVAKLTRLHHEPLLEYVTEVESELSYVWSIDTGATAIQPRAVKLWDGFQVSLVTDLAGGLGLQAMLTHGGVSAQVSLKLADGTTVETWLWLDLARLTGPWESGPVETVLAGARATLTNRIERAVDVSDLVVYATGGSAESVRVERQIKSGEVWTVDLPSPPAEAFPVHTVPGGEAAQLTEVAGFVEDIHTNMVFVNLVNFGNHLLKRLDIRVKMKDINGPEVAVALSEAEPVGEANFVLPLTAYLRAQVAQFQVTKVKSGDDATTTAWIDWDMAVQGNVVSITWDLIQ